MEQSLPVGINAEPKVVSQKSAVRNAISSASASTGVSVADMKNKEVKSVEKRQAMTLARNSILDGLKSGVIALKKEKSESELKRYASSLLSNWLKRDSELN